MAFIDLFDSADKKKKLSHIKNLVVLAASDGEIDKSEFDLILSIGKRIGLSPDELHRIVKRPDSVNFRAPDSVRLRIEQLLEMVFVMMVDGEIHENEVALCKLTAMRLGFKPQVIDKMVKDIIDMIVQGLAIDLVLSNLERKYA